MVCELTWVDVATGISAIVASIGLVSAGFWAIVQYDNTNQERLEFDRRELAWLKTDSLLKLGAEFDSNPSIQKALLLIEEEEPHKSISEMYTKSGSPTLKNPESHMCMESLLNFLDRLAYAVLKLETISGSELSPFGWYFYQTNKIPQLRNYMLNNGYQRIPMAAERFLKWGEDDPDDYPDDVQEILAEARELRKAAKEV